MVVIQAKELEVVFNGARMTRSDTQNVSGNLWLEL